jgi:hypothetical protein
MTQDVWIRRRRGSLQPTPNSPGMRGSRGSDPPWLRHRRQAQRLRRPIRACEVSESSGLKYRGAREAGLVICRLASKQQSAVRAAARSNQQRAAADERTPRRRLRRSKLVGILSQMSRGPTRRVRRLLDSGAVSLELLTAADHEADLLGHPYIGVEHLQLGRLAIEGRVDERAELRRSLAQGVPKRRWRPLGPRSAMRRAGLQQTESRRLAAQRREKRSSS